MGLDRGRDMAHTVAKKYGIPEEMVLFTVQTPQEAMKKSKGFKVAFVVTLFPHDWRMLYKNIVALLIGENPQMTINGALARQLEGLADSLGFDGRAVKRGLFTGALTFPKESLKPDHLNNL